MYEVYNASASWFLANRSKHPYVIKGAYCRSAQYILKPGGYDIYWLVGACVWKIARHVLCLGYDLICCSTGRGT